MSKWYDEFRARAIGRPVAHGNGFVQVPLDNDERLHVWHPQCPRQRVYTGTHDHRFRFESRILTGRLMNRIWTWAQGYDYRIYHADDDDKLAWSGDTCRLIHYSDAVHGPGESYQMNWKWLHDSVPVTAMVATVMRKTDVNRDYKAKVLCVTEERPDNEFRRDARSEMFLWALVREVLR